MRNMTFLHAFLASTALALATGGCGLILGLGDFTDGTGGGGGTGTFCKPSEIATCAPYTGPANTEGVGNCKASEKTCSMDGSQYGACSMAVTPSTEDCKIRGDEDCDGIACSDAIWGRLSGDGMDQSPTGIAVDSTGNVVVAGTFKGTLALDKDHAATSAGGLDFFLAKFDASGAPLWIKSFGDVTDNGTMIAVAVNKADEIVISGGLSGQVNFGGGILPNAGGKDIFVAKFDPQGTYRWAHTYGDSLDQYANGVASDSQGDIIICGVYQGSFGGLLAANGFDAFVIKLSAGGTQLVWAKRFGEKQGSSAQVASTVTIDPMNNIIVVGEFDASLDLGVASFTDKGGGDIFLVKLDPSGTPIPGTAKQFGSTGLDSSTAIALDSAGQIRLTGYFQNTIDFGNGKTLAAQGLYDGFVAGFDATGNYQWGQRFGATNDKNGIPDTGTGIAVDKDDNVFLTGVTYGDTNFGGPADALISQGGADIVLVKLDKNGKHLWSKIFGDLNDQTSSGIAIDRANKGEILLAGSVQGSIDLGTGKLSSMGGLDALVARFYP